MGGKAMFLNFGSFVIASGCAAASASCAVTSRRVPTLAHPVLEPSVVWGSSNGPLANADPRCAALVSETEQHLRALRSPFPSAPPAENKAALADFRRQVAAHTACVPTAHGVWAIVFEGDADPGQWIWSVVHLAESGSRAQHAGNFPTQIDGHARPDSYTGKADPFDTSAYRGPVGLQVVSDYDDDREPEVVVWTAEVGDEVRSTTRGMLWSFTNGAVAPYAKTATRSVGPFDGDFDFGNDANPLRDADGDGRIDLLGYGPFLGVYPRTCSVVESFEALGPRLVVHATPDGSFSDHDAVVAESAKRACPAPPAEIFAVDDHGRVDERATFRRLACARLWSVPLSTLEAERRRVCGDEKASSPACETARKCSPELLHVFADWSRKKLPFLLRAP